MLTYVYTMPVKSELGSPSSGFSVALLSLSTKSWHAPAGKPQDPTVLAVHSQHIHADLTGWRTPKGLLLREPVNASFTYTPALAK